MQILKDTAALAIILLLALTVRVHTGRTPLDLELTPPVEAGITGTPEGTAERSTELRAEILRLADEGAGCSEESEPRRMLVIEQRLESLPQALSGLSRLSRAESWTIEIAPEAAAAPVPEAEPDACRTIHDPALAC